MGGVEGLPRKSIQHPKVISVSESGGISLRFLLRNLLSSACSFWQEQALPEFHCTTPNPAFVLLLAKPGVRIATSNHEKSRAKARLFSWLERKNLFQTFELADRQQIEAEIHAVKALLDENDILDKDD